MTLGQFEDSHGLELLLANQNCDGGWGYHLGSSSAVEPTSWALMALATWRRSPISAAVRARACQWLLETQGADGSWPAFPGQPQGCWVTSVASEALHLQGGAENAVRRGMLWLLNAWPADGTLWWRVRQALLFARVAHQDNSLCGWNWTPGTASWVEPTAHALMFLRTLPHHFLPAQAAKRRQMAERMLCDRMCPGGGWNSGNPLVYGVAGVPRVSTTAWALLALRDQCQRPEVEMSLSWLEGAYRTICGPASLALAYRCLATYARQPSRISPDISELHAHNGFLENVLTLAWVLIALSEDGRLATLPAQEVLNP